MQNVEKQIEAFEKLMSHWHTGASSNHSSQIEDGGAELRLLLVNIKGEVVREVKRSE